MANPTQELTFFPLPSRFTKEPSREIPYSLEAERACLGSVLINNALYDEVFSKLRIHDFFDERNRMVIQAMQDMRIESGHAPIDLVTIATRLNDTQNLARIGGPDYLDFLSLSIPTTVNVDHYVKIVKEKSLLRQIIAISEEGSDLAKSNHSSEEIIEKLQQNYYDLLADDYREYRRVTDGLNNAVDTLSRIASGEEDIGLLTHFVDLDKIVGGLQRSNLIIVGGRTGMGKTAFALSLILRIAGTDRKGKTPPAVGLFSLEMSEREICSRLLSATANHTLSAIKTRSFAEQHWSDLTDAADELKKMSLFIDDTPGININELRLKARRMAQKDGVELIVIDYLQLISSIETNAPREQQISNISKQLKTLARELDIPIITLTQLNRSADHREDKVPRLSDIRESGAIEQDADLVMFLHRPSYDVAKKAVPLNRDNLDNMGDLSSDDGGSPDDYDSSQDNYDGAFGDGAPSEREARLYISKNRQGPTGMVPLEFDPKYMRFSDYFPPTY